jgi:3',5'-nucleoside bisphosphate phosphatase
MTNSILQDIKVDLHLHTTASDGTWTPRRLIRNINDAGIRLFAVTDHDTTDNIAEMAMLAGEYELKFIPGVEVNAAWENNNYHILGLGIDMADKELQKLLHHNRKLLENKDLISINYLEKKFPGVSFEEFETYVNNPERGGWKALNYIIDKKLCCNYREFFSLFDKGDNPLEKTGFASPEEVVKTIRSAGGYAILAHPGASFYHKDYKSTTAFMLQAGISGIECFHPENSDEITRYCLELCERNELLVTGGSDCHGEFVVGRCLGKPDIRLSQLHLGKLLPSSF